MKYRLVPEEELMRLISDQMVLVALEQGGVDNWDWYSESLWNLAEDLNKEGQFVEKIDCANEVFDTYTEKETEKYDPVSVEEYENGVLAIFSERNKDGV